jgi:tetratricopeptide (TPR) repeat protein
MPRTRPGMGGRALEREHEKDGLRKFGKKDDLDALQKQDIVTKPTDAADAKSSKTAKTDDEEEDKSPAAEPYGKGVASQDKGDHDAAIAFFSRAIQLDAKYAGLLRSRTVVRDERRQRKGIGRSESSGPTGARRWPLLLQPWFRVLSAR